jgi:hypothetical protein
VDRRRKVVRGVQERGGNRRDYSTGLHYASAGYETEKLTEFKAEELRRRKYGYKYEKANMITSAITFPSVLAVM